MKKTIAIVVTTILLSGASALAQGTIVFMNRVATGNAALVFLDAADGGGAVSGAGYSVQLFAGPTALNLVAVGSPLPFRTGAAAGAWNNTTLTIPNVAAGAVAQLQARAWNNRAGTLADYASAQTASLGQIGTSAVFASGPLGGFGTPPSTPPNTFGNSVASGIPNIASFTLSPNVPEPSVLALGALGGLALLIRRRK
jgi:hypothetical protein